MAKKKLVIEIEFDEVEDEFDEGYTFLEFESMKLAENTELNAKELDGLAESWGQSDWYSVGFCNALIALLDNGREIKSEDVRM